MWALKYSAHSVRRAKNANIHVMNMLASLTMTYPCILSGAMVALVMISITGINKRMMCKNCWNVNKNDVRLSPWIKWEGFAINCTEVSSKSQCPSRRLQFNTELPVLCSSLTISWTDGDSSSDNKVCRLLSARIFLFFHSWSRNRKKIKKRRTAGGKVPMMHLGKPESVDVWLVKVSLKSQ